ncbi:KR-domain-containing protein [Zopfia rhizophila CBS 207.26]|uniref:KR-domain-containing protein n=1 Tax=Zopfia rhizophila CBS 207.26 TaxID=1314779 RepID=A0A6A6ENS0_9PEZI|nr:KR-domain-containing protein [Zopfia rhizophila CBS 207.26]
MRVFKWEPVESTYHAQRHATYPTTLYAATQLMLAVLTKCGIVNIPTTIPTRISKAWISDIGFNCFDADNLLAYSRTDFTANSQQSVELAQLSFMSDTLTVLDVNPTQEMEAHHKQYMDWTRQTLVSHEKTLDPRVAEVCRSKDHLPEFIENETVLVLAQILKCLGDACRANDDYALPHMTTLMSRLGIFRMHKSDSGPMGQDSDSERLGVNVDSSKQEFELVSYDVVIAGNEPGGIALESAVTSETSREACEEDFRRQGPHVSSEKWNGLLQSTGFSGIDLEVPDFPNYEYNQSSIIVSTALELPPEPTPISPITVVVDSSQFHHTVVPTSILCILLHIIHVGDAVVPNFSPGDRVVACAIHAFRSYVRCQLQCAIPLPDNIPFVNANAVPVTYSTAHHAFVKLAQLRSGEAALIHLGAGATGQAAIQLAQIMGATVYATVNSPEKKKFLMGTSKLPIYQFDLNVSFFTFDASLVLMGRPDIFPRPITVYGTADTEKAFRHFQLGKLISKMVVEMRPDHILNVIVGTTAACELRKGATYVIAGGLGGLGRSVARWMVSRRAKNLLLLSRKGPVADEIIQLIEELKSNNVNVEAPACDIASAGAPLTVLDHCANTMRPIRGCVQGTMALRDNIFENMNFEDWQTSISPKVAGPWNLHYLLPWNLDFFLFLSSISAITGMASQANYAAGKFVHGRFGLPPRCKWSTSNYPESWMDGLRGHRFGEQDRRTTTRWDGMLHPIKTEEFLALLDYFCS